MWSLLAVWSFATSRRLFQIGILIAGIGSGFLGLGDAASPPSGLSAIGGVPRLPAGTRGVIAVVAQGPYGQYGEGRIVPIVLRNNTRSVVSSVHVSGTVFDSKGRLTATGEDQGIHPAVVRPAGLAIGYVFFDDRNLPATTRFKFHVRGTPAGQDTYNSNVDLRMKTLRYVGGHVVGIANNPTPRKVSGPLSVYASCFSKANRIVAFHSGFADEGDAPPHANVPFTVDFTGYGTQAAPTCAHMLVSMVGFKF